MHASSGADAGPWQSYRCCLNVNRREMRGFATCRPMNEINTDRCKHLTLMLLAQLTGASAKPTQRVQLQGHTALLNSRNTDRPCPRHCSFLRKQCIGVMTSEPQQCLLMGYDALAGSFGISIFQHWSPSLLCPLSHSPRKFKCGCRVMMVAP